MSAASDAFGDLLEGTAQRLQLELQVNLAEVQAYAAERIDHLSLIATEPGFDEAVLAEAHNVMLFSAGRTVDMADAADREFFGVIAGGLRIAGALLAAA